MSHPNGTMESVLEGEPVRLTSRDGRLITALAGSGKERLEQEVLPQLLPKQRWFGAKDRVIEGVELLPLGELEAGQHALMVADVAVGGETQRYLLPVSANWDGGDRSVSPLLANIESAGRMGSLRDGALEKGFAKALIAGLRDEARLQGDGGEVVFRAGASLKSASDIGEPRPLGAEQSNVSIAFGDTTILKLYRRLRSGDQPDVEVARFLSEVGHYANTPEFLGEIQFRPATGEATTLAAAFAFVPNQGDAWSVVTEALFEDLRQESAEGPAAFDEQLAIGAILGRRTAELHKSLSVATADKDFAVEKLTADDVSSWVEEAVSEAEALLDRLAEGLSRLSPNARRVAEEVLGKRDTLISRLRGSADMVPSGGRSRIHGDYHLGQVLVAEDDVIVIDFEGEPKRSLAERRAKSSPLRDVAGMLRSFHYAAWTAVNRYRQESGEAGHAAAARAELWRRTATADFLGAYEEHVAGATSYPTDRAFAQALTELFLLQKAIYEVGYELANRPDWVEIPLRGVDELLK